MKEKRLIVNADDFGMSRGITDGIILAHLNGVVTSASLMANMPAAEYAVSRLENILNVGMGVHLNICQGRPLLPAHEVPSLVDGAGNFHRPAVMARKLWLWQASAGEIEAEFRAQIRWMKMQGIVPAHADSHHHMHLYPAAVKPFARALAAEGIRCARAPRCGAWPNRGAIGGPHGGPMVRRVFVQAYRSTLQFAILRQFDLPDYRLSLRLHKEHNLLDPLGSWKFAYANLPDGTCELACHPGIFERGFSEADSIHAQREEELRWLTSGEMRNAIEQAGIRLITYRDLAGSAAARHTAAEAPAL